MHYDEVSKLYIECRGSQFQGEELRKQIGAAYYVECSSKTQQVSLLLYLSAENVFYTVFQKISPVLD